MRYNLPVVRQVRVSSFRKDGENFTIETSAGKLSARSVVSATRSLQKPFIPSFPGQEEFEGMQLHSAHYKSPEQFAGQTVLIVGIDSRRRKFRGADYG